MHKIHKEEEKGGRVPLLEWYFYSCAVPLFRVNKLDYLVAFPRGLKGLEGNRACYSYFVVHNYLLNQFCIHFSGTTIMAQEKAISCL